MIVEHPHRIMWQKRVEGEICVLPRVTLRHWPKSNAWYYMCTHPLKWNLMKPLERRIYIRTCDWCAKQNSRLNGGRDHSAD